MSNPDILDEFDAKLKTEWKRESSCGSYFYLRTKIVEWMCQVEPSRPGNRQNDDPQNNVVHLLEGVFENRRGSIFPIDSTQILSQHKPHCAIVLAILISLKHGHLVSIFRECSVDDTGLHNEIRSNARLITELEYAGVSDPEALLRDFDVEKWHFLTPTLNFRDGSNLEILPFNKRKQITRGGTATVWEAIIQKDLLPVDFHPAVKSTIHVHDELGECFQVAIKSYPEAWWDSFKLETDAFRGIRQMDGVVQYLGHFTHYERGPGGPTGKRTYNIILEYGDLDLMEFFADPYQHPPVLTVEIIDFWTLFLKIAGVIDKIHNLRYLSADKREGHYNGWHADIKPQNILRVKGAFKLADFGFAKFEKVNKHQKEGTAPLTNVYGGTDEFGAPEVYRNRRSDTITEVTQAIDVWSFGCVLSVVATWIVLGYQGVQQYKRVRENALARLNAKGVASDSVATGLSRFHDGKAVLREVKQWHQLLRTHLRASDTVTKQILNLVDRHLLLGTPSDRWNATQVSKELERIIEEAKLDVDHTSIDQNILDSLLAQDKAAPAAQELRQREQLNSSTLENERPTQIGPGTTTGKSERIDRDHRLSVRGQIAGRTKALEAVLKINIPEESEEPEERQPSAGPSTPNARVNIHLPQHPPAIDRRGPVQNYGGNGYSMAEGVENSPAPIGSPGISPGPNRHPSHSRQTSTTSTTRPLSRDPLGLPRVMTGFENSRPSVSPSSGPSPAQFATVPVPIAIEHKRLSDVFNKKKPWKSLPGDKELKKYIENRDLVFVADNGSSMFDHWDRATLVMHTLAMKLQKLDDDGMDLYFTLGTQEPSTSKGHQKFKTWMTEARPKRFGTTTDITRTMDTIFRRFLSGPKDRKMTVIVLTDGVWQDSLTTLEKTIVQFWKGLKEKIGGYPYRYFTIQFISFGNDLGGLERLRYLDEDFHKNPEHAEHDVPDFIDTTPWDGPVDKMVLGSLDEKMDGQAESSNRPPTGGETTPSTPTPSGRHHGAMVMSPSARSGFAQPVSQPVSQPGWQPVYPQGFPPVFPSGYQPGFPPGFPPQSNFPPGPRLPPQPSHQPTGPPEREKRISKRISNLFTSR